MQTWQIGTSTVTRIEELSGPLFDPTTFFPDYDPEVIDKHHAWLFPNHMSASGDRIIASIHSWLIQTPHHNLLIDSCIGNDKDRMPFRDWDHMQTPYMDNFRATGIGPDDIDYVLCTHLHVDHVGWNTRLKDGQWVPTFPNARYIFAKDEYDFWLAERDKADEAAFNSVNRKTFDDSVMPIMHLSELIEGEHELIADLVHLSPAPGHTPGSITISLNEKSQSAIFTGDIFHHPLQIYEPHWNSAFCEQPDRARQTRQRVLEDCLESQALMMPAHFGPCHAGHVQEKAGSFLFDFADEG